MLPTGLPSIYFDLMACPFPAEDSPFDPTDAPWFEYLPPAMQAHCRADFVSWGNDRESWSRPRDAALIGGVDSMFKMWFRNWRSTGAVQAVRQLVPELDGVVAALLDTEQGAFLEETGAFDETWPMLVAASRSA